MNESNYYNSARNYAFINNNRLVSPTPSLLFPLNDNSSTINGTSGLVLSSIHSTDLCTIERGLHDYITIVFCLLTSCFGYPLNGFAIFRLQRISGQRAHSRLKMLSVSMILANFMVLSFPCFGKALWYISYYWYGHVFMCKLYKFFESTAVFFMSNIMISVAVDMLYAFKFPFSDGRKRVKFLILLSGGIALSLAIPQLYFWTVLSRVVECGGDNRTISQCVMMPIDNPRVTDGYAWFHLSVIFWLPLAVLVPCYTCVLVLIIKQTLWQQKHAACSTPNSTNNSIQNFQTPETPSSDSNGRFANLSLGDSSLPNQKCRARIRSKYGLIKTRDIDNKNGIRNNLRPKSKHWGIMVPVLVRRRFRKGIKMVMRVVGIYIVLWLPYETAAMLQFFFPDFFRSYENYLGWLYLLYLTNTCINPFMHAVRRTPAITGASTKFTVCEHGSGHNNYNNKHKRLSPNTSGGIPHPLTKLKPPVKLKLIAKDSPTNESNHVNRINDDLTMSPLPSPSPYNYKLLVRQRNLVCEDDSLYSTNSLNSPVTISENCF